MNFENLKWQEGSKNLPGIRRTLYYISKQDITTWPTLNEDAVTAAERVTYSGSFTLADAKNFKTLDVVMRKSQPTSEAQGELEASSVLNKLSLMHAGTEEDAVDFQRQGNRDDIVYIFEDKNGKFRVVGSEHFRTSTRVNLDLGSEPSSEKGTTIEVEATDVCLPFYEGSIMTDEGDANPTS